MGRILAKKTESSFAPSHSFRRCATFWRGSGDLFSRVTSQDAVIGSDGKNHVSDQATIWRWREAFQHDFAARVDWTIKSFAEANHNPIVVVNGQTGTAPIFVEALLGQPIVPDASQSHDPDG
jgi:hypothetical protein